MISSVEHSGISAALDAVGIKSEMPSYITKTLVFLAWSNKEKLLFNPAYAWLSLSTISYVQLPVSRSSLLEKLKNTSDVKLDAADEFLFFPLGQWNWAVQQLEICRVEEKSEEAVLRLTYLRRFALKYWLGWYDEIFRRLTLKMRNADDCTAEILKLSQESILVAVFEAIRPLTDWVTDKEKMDQILAARDCIFYLNLGSGVVSDIKDTLTWRENFEDDIKRSELALKSFGITEQEISNTIGGCLNNLKVGLESLKELSDSATEISADLLLHCSHSIELITTNLSESRRLHNSVRAKLAETK